MFDLLPRPLARDNQPIQHAAQPGRMILNEDVNNDVYIALINPLPGAPTQAVVIRPTSSTRKQVN